MGLFSKKSAPQPSARPEYIEVGQIVNTHGVRGEVKVQPWDVRAGLVSGFRTFYMDGEPFRPTSKRVQGDMVLMKLPEIDAMDAATEMKNAKAFNMIVLGGLLKIKPMVSLENVLKGLKKSLPERHHKLIPMNEQAILKGMELIKKA